MRRLLLASLLALAACPSPQQIVAPPPPPPPMPKVPPGCELSLAGVYRHRDDQSYRYALTDDGATVHVRAFRQFGATEKPIESSAAEFDLHRTPTGLRGAAQVEAKTLSGQRTCSVQYPYEVTACSASSLTLRTVQMVRLTESCEPEDPLHPDSISNVLIRVQPEAEDAGLTPDAGGPLLDAGAAFDAGASLDAGAAAAPVDAGVVTQSVAIDAGSQSRP